MAKKFGRIESTLAQCPNEFFASTLGHLCQIDPFVKIKPFRSTGIVCTIGPSCWEIPILVEMIKAGMCIARFNFSHGTHENQKKMMDAVRTAADQVSKFHPIALALDTKGPEIRTGLNKDGANISVKKDDIIVVTSDEAFKESSTAEKLFIDYKSLTTSISVGQIILVSDGNLVLEALSISGSDVRCKVISGHTFGSRKNVSLPKVKVDLPALSEKDISDIKFGIEQKVDIIFASFIRNADNVLEIRKLLDTYEHGKRILIVSKIENYEGVENIAEIIDESDGIMVARGDLGMDLDIERITVAQKKIMAMCKLKGKPVICATQMLESMINSYRPTRAEVADVTNAVLDGADCVMLSGESANGKYPVQTIKTMSAICVMTETMHSAHHFYEDVKNSFSYMTDLQATAMASVSISYKLKADGIFVLSNTGSTAKAISMFHPSCPIFCITRDLIVARCSHLWNGIYPIYYSTPENVSSWTEDVDNRFKFALEHAIKTACIKPGSKLIFVTGWKSGSGASNCVRIANVNSDFEIVGL